MTADAFPALPPRTGPERPSVWLFGESGSAVQVWAAVADPAVRVSVLIGSVGPPIVMLNRRLVGTPAEQTAISWALAKIAEGARGYLLWCD